MRAPRPLLEQRGEGCFSSGHQIWLLHFWQVRTESPKSQTSVLTWRNDDPSWPTSGQTVSHWPYFPLLGQSETEWSAGNSCRKPVSVVPVVVWVFITATRVYHFLIHKMRVVLDSLLRFNMCLFCSYSYINMHVSNFTKIVINTHAILKFYLLKLEINYIIILFIIITCYCSKNIILIFIKLKIVCLIVLLLSEK